MFVVVSLSCLFVYCKKNSDIKAETYATERKWIHENGGIYKNEKLVMKSIDGAIRTASLNWSQVYTFKIGQVEYTEIPFSFATGTINDNVAFSFMIRTFNGKTEAAIKFSQKNATLRSEKADLRGTIEGYSKLDGTKLDIWFLNETTGRLMSGHLSPSGVATVKVDGIKAKGVIPSYMSEPCSYYIVDTFQYHCWLTGGSYNDTACGWLLVDSQMYQFCNGGDGGGGGGGGENWPPPGGGGTPPPPPPPPPNPQTPCPTSGTALKNAFPTATETTLNALAELVNTYGGQFGLNTEDKLQHFLAQAAAETGGFGTLNKTESLNYTHADRLEKVFPKLFSLTDPNKRDPNNYLYNSEVVANVVYSNRFGNGSEASGDGYRYRGRGIMQLTWKDNYTAFQNFYNNANPTDQIDPVSNPNILASNAKLAVTSALWFFKTRVLDKITVDANTSVEKVSKKVNGGILNGITERKTYFQNAKSNIHCL